MPPKKADRESNPQRPRAAPAVRLGWKYRSGVSRAAPIEEYYGVGAIGILPMTPRGDWIERPS
jgi:hypothetical protein